MAGYIYDYLGRRINKTVNGQITKYLYDGDRIIAHYNNSGTLVHKFIYGPGIDEPIMMIVVDGQTETQYYYHFDGLGSVVALSNINGVLVECYEYDVFGQPTIRDASGSTRTTSAFGNRFMFTGREYDNEVGLYYYRARYYKPSLGRFLQSSDVN